MPRYWILDKSSADEIGNVEGQAYDEVIATLNELLEEHDQALDDLIVIQGQAISKLVKTVVSFDDSNRAS